MTHRRLIAASAAVSLLGVLAVSAGRAAEPPALAPLPPPSAPADNPTTPAKVELGKKLFWDGRLSGNGAMPCVACHLPDLGWGTGGAISFGYPSTQHWRNSQTILNSAYYNKLFWDGAVTSLESQASAAAGGAVAGNGDGSMMEMRLRFVPEYVKDFREVFGTPWPNINDAWKAISAFQRTIVSDPKKVPFDRYLTGDQSAIDEPAKRGLALFRGKANCQACHNGPLLSDQKFHDIGVPRTAIFDEDPLYQITVRWQLYQKGHGEAIYRKGDRDLGLFHVTKNPKDVGKFRTPSLREIAYTAPYMHNGALETLEQVIDFYDRGGGASPNKSALLKPLNLSAAEKSDLLAFLRTLSMDAPLLMPEPSLPETKPLRWGK